MEEEADFGRAAVRHLLTLAPRFDELPPALRAHLRAMVCRAVAGQRKVQKRASAAPIFEDVHGAFHSLDALLRDDLACGLHARFFQVKCFVFSGGHVVDFLKAGLGSVSAMADHAKSHRLRDSDGVIEPVRHLPRVRQPP